MAPEGAWTYMADLNLKNPLMMQRVMLLIYRLIHPLTSIDMEFPDKLSHTYLSRLERNSIKRLLDETLDNELLFQMLVWFSGHWDEDEETVLDAAQEMKTWCTWEVRRPKIYPVEAEKERVKWDQARGDDMCVVRAKGERSWRECKGVFQERAKFRFPVLKVDSDSKLRKTYGEMETFVKEPLPKYDWDFEDEGVETEEYSESEAGDEEGDEDADDEDGDEPEEEPKTVNIFEQTILPGGARTTRAGTKYNSLSEATWEEYPLELLTPDAASTQKVLQSRPRGRSAMPPAPPRLPQRKTSTQLPTKCRKGRKSMGDQ